MPQPKLADGLAATVESLPRHRPPAMTLSLGETVESLQRPHVCSVPLVLDKTRELRGEGPPPIPSTWAGTEIPPPRHQLRVLMGEGRVETVDFDGTSLSVVAKMFLQRHGLKPIVMEGLLHRMNSMLEAQRAQATVDLVDLI
eukprot:1851621-Amphidinium_carterae.1